MTTCLEASYRPDYGGDSLLTVAPETRMSRQTMERFAHEVSRRALRMAEAATRHREASLDIVQDSLLAMVSRYADRPEAEWPALFHTILYSRIMDWRRREARRSRWLVWLCPKDEEDDADPWLNVPDPVDGDPAALLERADDLDRVQAVLAGLPLRQQQAFLLRAWEGLDVAATAQVMDCSPSSVKTHYVRAVAALRRGLEEFEDE